MSNLFKKIFSQNLKPEPQKGPQGKPHRGKYMPDEKSPADERFTKHFILNGGKFLYCVDMNEVQESFDNILLENDWYENEVFCIDDNLAASFKGYNLNFGKSQEASFLLSTCENLVADDGSLLICSNQIKEKKLKELPQDFVIFATTSQIVNNIGEGLRGIKSKNTKSIPTNITTIKNFEPDGVSKDFMSYGSSAKNLYLLLLEDL
ncbi:LUD domain-containing protein [Flavimarina sp. Hel_I_48]|uniref:LUD domain-containing protein n=1 Tax=Flavimarina sp. Hel_I_48 TaxID=1392488 RepID=UPI0004DF3C85|nr:LUD domain-containing protein [Flavimarina sp. Hel_I_48]